MARMKNWLLGVVAFLMLFSAVPAARAQVIVIGRGRRHYYHRRYYRDRRYYHHRYYR